jgi:hypothetical protein
MKLTFLVRQDSFQRPAMTQHLKHFIEGAYTESSGGARMSLDSI